MDLLKILKKNLFIQNFVASIISFIPPYLEFSVAKYLAIKKAMYITAHDATNGSYLEFGVFTGSSFNFAMKANKKIFRIFIIFLPPFELLGYYGLKRSRISVYYIKVFSN